MVDMIWVMIVAGKLGSWCKEMMLQQVSLSPARSSSVIDASQKIHRLVASYKIHLGYQPIVRFL